MYGKNQKIYKGKYNTIFSAETYILPTGFLKTFEKNLRIDEKCAT